MTTREFTKTEVVIYKSHKLKNNFISVSFAYRYNATTVSTIKKLEIENKGGAAKSLMAYLGL
jgi:hypothetical protein